MMWMLIVAHAATGPINILHAGRYHSISECTQAGRGLERELMASGRRATAVCLEVRR